MFARLRLTAAVLLGFVSSPAAVAPAAAQTNRPAGTHKLIVAVEKTMAPAAEKKLAILVLISRNGGARAGAVATPSKPLTVLQQKSGIYRVEAEIDSRCKGSCDASYRVTGSTDHRLEVIPSCKLRGASFACSRVRIVKLY
jgi:hypothetical protein